MIYIRVSDIINHSSYKDCHDLYKEGRFCKGECDGDCSIDDTFECDVCNNRYYDIPYFSYTIEGKPFLFKKYIENKYNITINNSTRLICSEKCMDNDAKLIKKYTTDENIKEFTKKHRETYYARYQIFLNFLYENNIQYKDYALLKNKTHADYESYLNFADSRAKQNLFTTILDNCRVLNERSPQIMVSDFCCSKCYGRFKGIPYKQDESGDICSFSCEKEFDLF